MTLPVTRFAPSPTGLMHLGHAHAALFAERAARDGGGTFLLRIEDIDRARCRAAFETAIFEDIAWLGLEWEEPVMRQSERGAAYGEALERLDALGVLYPCFCTRRDIAAEIAAAGAAPHGAAPHHAGATPHHAGTGDGGAGDGARAGPDGPVYPGTCRGLPTAERAARKDRGVAFALRLDSEKAAALAGDVAFTDGLRGATRADPRLLGDAVVARKDIATSYHLAVVVDDAAQGVTLVTRGDDLLPSTHLHRLLQALLGLAVPDYHHHPMIEDDAGARLAKRGGAASLRALRESGRTPAETRALAGFAD